MEVMRPLANMINKNNLIFNFQVSLIFINNVVPYCILLCFVKEKRLKQHSGRERVALEIVYLFHHFLFLI